MQSDSHQSVTIVIPVYNEDSCIEKVITDWHDKLDGLGVTHNILIVNDGSTDNTLTILEALNENASYLSVINQENQGHGHAIKNGYAQALSLKSDYIFQTDSDDQFRPEDFLKFWQRRHESPALFGIRANRQDPLGRKIISSYLKRLIFNFFEVEIPDANIPYRLFKSEYLKVLIQALPVGVFAPNIFLSIMAHKSNPQTPSIAIKHYKREDEAQAKLIKLGLIKACIQSFKEVLSFSYNIKNKVAFINEKYQQDYQNSNAQSSIVHEQAKAA